MHYFILYGVSGPVLWLFGDTSVWHMHVQVLGSLDDDVAMGFRNSIQNECTMKAVAVLPAPTLFAKTELI